MASQLKRRPFLPGNGQDMPEYNIIYVTARTNA